MWGGEKTYTWKDFVPKTNPKYFEIYTESLKENFSYRLKLPSGTYLTADESGNIVLSGSKLGMSISDGEANIKQTFACSLEIHKSTADEEEYEEVTTSNNLITLNVELAYYFRHITISGNISVQYNIWTSAGGVAAVMHPYSEKYGTLTSSATNSLETGTMLSVSVLYQFIDDLFSKDVTFTITSYKSDVKTKLFEFTDTVNLNSLLTELSNKDTNDTNGFLYNAFIDYRSSYSAFFDDKTASMDETELKAAYDNGTASKEELDKSSLTYYKVNVDQGDESIKDDIYASRVCLFTNNKCYFAFEIINKSDHDAIVTCNNVEYNVPKKSTVQIETNASFVYSNFDANISFTIRCDDLDYAATYTINGWEYLLLGIEEIQRELDDRNTLTAAEIDTLYEQLQMFLRLYEFAKSLEIYKLRTQLNG